MGTELVISIGKIQVQERSPYYLYSIALYSIVELAGMEILRPRGGMACVLPLKVN